MQIALYFGLWLYSFTACYILLKNKILFQTYRRSDNAGTVITNDFEVTMGFVTILSPRICFLILSSGYKCSWFHWLSGISKNRTASQVGTSWELRHNASCAFTGQGSGTKELNTAGRVSWSQWPIDNPTQVKVINQDLGPSKDTSQEQQEMVAETRLGDKVGTWWQVWNIVPRSIQETGLGTLQNSSDKDWKPRSAVKWSSWAHG